MRFSLTRIAVVAVALVILAFGVPGIGEDYLVIKKKDGSVERVPLKFDPTQIDSFNIETAPTPVKPGVEPTPPAAEKPEAVPSGEFEEESEKKPEPKPMEISPRDPSSKPMILKRTKPEAAPEQRTPAKGPSQTYRGPVAAPPVSAIKGAPFTVNVYKLPDRVRALPDYSALRPVRVITTDSINLNPEMGGNEPSTLPEDTQGLGMRFQGLFGVSGEGIFRWRLLSRDGARMHIDDKTLIENDGIHKSGSKIGFVHLAEGVHSIIVDSFNTAGPPVLTLYVTPPLGKEQVFSLRNGLRGWKEPKKPYDVLWAQVYFVPKGKYPRGPNFTRISPVGRLIASALNIDGTNGIPGIPGRKKMIGLKYEGFFSVEGAGIFAFRLRADHYARLAIGKKNIIKSSKFGPEGRVAWAFLQKGGYPITVEYFHPQGEPRLQLFVTEPKKEEALFSPANELVGFAADADKISLIPAFVYFLKPGTKKLPNLNKMKASGMAFVKAIDFPVDRGTQEFPGVPKRKNWLGLRFYVKFSLGKDEEGTYKFRIVARDGARLIIGKKIVVKATGFGKLQEKSGQVTLPPGSHEMFLDYYQATGPNALQLYITPPGGEEKIFAFQ